MDISEMYESGMSLTQIAKATGVSISTVRCRLIANGVKMRTRKEALRIAAKDGRLGGGIRGKKRPPLSAETLARMKAGKLRYGEERAKGVRVTSSGYIEYTRGPRKGRSVHVVAMEELIGRRLFVNECVHHKNSNRQDNRPENLELMTRAAHASLHMAWRMKQKSKNGEPGNDGD